MKKIITSFVYPPIPVRDHDWCAHYDGEEESNHCGWGETKEQAIQDLIENYPKDGPWCYEVVDEKTLPNKKS